MESGSGGFLGRTAYSDYAVTMTDDLRKQRLESSEGAGRARRVWEAYAATVNRLRPAVVDRAVQRLAVGWTEELVGFWVCWHLYGGFEGLQRAGWERRTIYRRLKKFRLAFGKHPDEYQLVGVGLDPEAFWDAYLDVDGRGDTGQ
jgi:hypothetical protein